MSDQIIIAGGGSRGLFFVDMLTNKLGRRVSAIADNYEPGHEAIYHRIAEFGTPDTKVFCSVQDALDSIPRTQADVLFVMTPEWTHMDVFRRAVEAGYHVFLEKPLATTKEDVLEILRLARSTDRTVQVGFVLRYSSFYQKIKQIIDAGMLGKVVAIQMNERLAISHGGVFKRAWQRRAEYTGGFINEKCSHDIDLMCWLKEEQASPAEVFSYGGTHFCKERDDTPERCTDCKLDNCPWRYKAHSTLKSIGDKLYFDDTSSGFGKCVFHSDSDITDHQTVLIKFDDGTQGVFTVIAASGDPGRDINVHGSAGYLQGSMEKGALRVQNYWGGEMQDIEIGTADGHGGGDIAIVRGFLEAIEQGAHPLATVEAGARASLIAFAADESIKSNKPVAWDW